MMTTTMMTLTKTTTAMSRSELLQLFTENIGLVYSASKKFIPAGMDQDDWEQECMLYVLEHLQYFDPTRSCWTTYVYLMVWSCVTRISRRLKTRRHISGQSISGSLRDDGSEIIQLLARDESDRLDDRIDAEERVRLLRSKARRGSQPIIDAVMAGNSLASVSRDLGVSRQSIEERWRKCVVNWQEGMRDGRIWID
jgi:RNA polymerase sigma factor (sigma-70 family)